MNLYLFDDSGSGSAATYGIGTWMRELLSTLRDSPVHVRVVHLRSAFPEFTVQEARYASRETEFERWHIPEARGRNTFDGDIRQMENY
jgi:hypothetical protein